LVKLFFEVLLKKIVSISSTKNGGKKISLRHYEKYPAIR